MPFVPGGETDGSKPTLLPDGWYRCRVARINPKQTSAGSEMWGVGFEVVEGDYKGRYLWDNFVFSDQGYQRVRMACSRMGIDLSEGGELTQEMVFGKEVMVKTQQQDYNRKDGTAATRNEVPYEGYEAIEGANEPTTGAVPF